MINHRDLVPAALVAVAIYCLLNMLADSSSLTATTQISISDKY